KLLRGVCVLPKAQLVFVASDESSSDEAGYVTAYDLKTGSVKKEWKAHKEMVQAIACSANEDRIATATNLEPIAIWERDGKLLATLDIPEIQEQDATCLEFSPQSQALAIGTYSGKVVLYDLERKKCVIDGNGHRGPVTMLSFDDVHHCLYSGGYD